MPQLAGKQLKNWHRGLASRLGEAKGPAAKLGTPTVRQALGSRWVLGWSPHQLLQAVPVHLSRPGNGAPPPSQTPLVPKMWGPHNPEQQREAPP